MRLVSLTCSNTEIVAALGCGDLLVGIDSHSDRPAEVVAGLPRVGPDLGIELDKVLALKPDLVLASLTVPGHERVVAGLEAAGLKTLVLEPVYLTDVYRDIRVIARALGVAERGERLVGEMQAECTAGPVPVRRPSLLVEWWPKPVIAPGQLSWVTDLITLAGGRNPLAERPIKSQPLSDEEVRRLLPDAFVLAWCGVAADKVRPEVVYRNALWQDLEALQQGRVYCVPEAYLGRPGPGLVAGFRALREIVAMTACTANR